MTDNENIDDDGLELKSKTQIKREVEALQHLGKLLLEVPDAVYKSFPIPAELDSALQETRRIKSNQALKRQYQYIGKVMRRIDAEPIQQAYDDYKNGRKKLAREFQRLEEVRDQLITGDQDALNQVIAEFPAVDIQQLRQLIRAAQQEKKLNKPPKNYRKLFQVLKSLKEESI
ncbi:Uncharacterised protein [BD1-7 clade bacterium]|uniref:Dual-action ribosomal maturation protein DarP n=1 Tax=BD1-7 clade bacterium TaxID=2029982 RepID=A0A5S9N4T0_9GAMM|nr:Uncharacterised protein [BD1-7 clade bacterium]CAA0084800.1 Uncharacterised protein [BD1-7 clade bacterium]